MSEQDVVSPPVAKTEDARGAAASPSGPGPDGRRSTRRQLALYATGGAIGALALLALGLYAWNVVSVGRLQARFAAERAQASSAQQQALQGQARELLRLTARPLAWSVRAELLRGNLGQIGDYFRELVRERGVSALLLVDKDGRIALATNRKLETQPAASVVSKALLEAPDFAVEESATTLRMAVPVMSFDRRIGTLVVDYEKSAP